MVLASLAEEEVPAGELVLAVVASVGAVLRAALFDPGGDIGDPG